ncbi:hypothetical protein FOZ62_004604 [Perkinsus olseni]|uniref:RanBP2-type domain-containing protein n=2 Tax=Perkinsus olseni TaxID=32597 RepID=A0A7J6PPV0_PEROL|nr:hypothetical protein FOZ62_004604 [Perkinsus olseni]
MSNYPGSSSWGNAPPPPSSSSDGQGPAGGSMDHHQPPPAPAGAGGYSGVPDSFDEARDGGLGWGSGDRSAMYNMSAGWGRPKHKQEVREGDWFCNTCGDHQFARNEYCRSCGAPKGAPPPDPATLEAEYMAAAAAYQMMSAYGMPAYDPYSSGGDPAGGMPMWPAWGGWGGWPGYYGKGKGGGGQVRRPGDWDCPNCGDMNFASRQVCRKCGTPHSFAASAGPEGAAAGPSTGASSLESTAALPDYSGAQESRPRSRSRSRDRRF